MSATDWIVLGCLVALGVAAAVRWRAWERPRVLVLIGLLIMLGVAVGAVIGLIVVDIDAISSTALWLVAIAVIVFEAYRWHRRRRLRS